MLSSVAVLICIIQFIQSAALPAPYRYQTPVQDTQYTQRIPSHRYNRLQKVPGDSPAYFTGNPSDDVLQIESLDLVSKPSNA
jgi:hypothetical protein